MPLDSYPCPLSVIARGQQRFEAPPHPLRIWLQSSGPRRPTRSPARTDPVPDYADSQRTNLSHFAGILTPL